MNLDHTDGALNAISAADLEVEMANIPGYLQPGLNVIVVDERGQLGTFFMTFRQIPKDGNLIKLFEEKMLPQLIRDGYRLPTDAELASYREALARQAASQMLHDMMGRAFENEALEEQANKAATGPVDLSKWVPGGKGN